MLEKLNGEKLETITKCPIQVNFFFKMTSERHRKATNDNDRSSTSYTATAGNQAAFLLNRACSFLESDCLILFCYVWIILE